VETLLVHFEAVVRRGELPSEADIAALEVAYEDAAAALARELAGG
jgi:hypothetical protein